MEEPGDMDGDSAFYKQALLRGETSWETALPLCCSVEEKGSSSQLWFYSLLFYFYFNFLGLKLTFSFNLCSPFWAREKTVPCFALVIVGWVDKCL